MITLHRGDALAVLRSLPDASVDAVVTDPPYGLAEHRPAAIAQAVTAWCTGDREHVPDGRGFMGRAWDGFVPPPAVWDECLRVLKPGGHLLAFAGSRTVDLMGLSVRLAGFEIRDSISWLYGTGFPKSLDVSKAIDKAAGAEREVVGSVCTRKIGGRNGVSTNHGRGRDDAHPGIRAATAPATPAAEQWQGWGTALKPGHEPIIVARKPLGETVAATVLAHGTGALNIDACRVPGAKPDTTRGASVKRSSMEGGELGGQGRIVDDGAGRWPANVVLDEDAASELDAQTGTLTSGKMQPTRPKGGNRSIYGQDAAAGYTTMETYGDSGGASRFFYCAKAPTSERPKVDGVAHPTVKPLALMRWLVRLVTPPGGVVLDPFAGSGTTGQAAHLEGFGALLVERTAEYWPLIEQRLGDELVTVDHVDAPVADEPDPILAAVAVARSNDELTAVWAAHVAAWTDEHIAAVRRRLAELGEVAA